MHGLLLPVNGKLMWVWKNKKKTNLQTYLHTGNWKRRAWTDTNTDTDMNLKPRWM